MTVTVMFAAFGRVSRLIALSEKKVIAWATALYQRLPASVHWWLNRCLGSLHNVYGQLPPPIRRGSQQLYAVAHLLVTPQTETDRERRRIAGLTVPFFVLAFFAAFVPLVYMTRMSVSADNLRNQGWSFSAWETVLTDSTYWWVAFNTLWFAAVTAAVGVVIGIGVTHALEKYDLPGERVLVAILSFPIALPGIVVAFMIVVLLGRQGLVTNLAALVTQQSSIDLASAYTVGGLFFGYIFSLIPRAAMVLRGTYAELNTAAEEAARALGASPAQTFYHVTLPEIRPGVIAAYILTFRTALAIFGTVLILQSLDVATLQIDKELNVGFNSQVAGVVGVVYFVFVLGFTFTALRYVETEVVEI